MNSNFKDSSDLRVAIIGLGYVGLPLALAFANCEHFKNEIIGFDVNEIRIAELNQGLDRNNEASKKDIYNTRNLRFTTNEKLLDVVDLFIVTVPTPIDSYKVPDLSKLKSATGLVAKFLKPGNVVVYESTVYPGCTINDCVPILQNVSNLTLNDDFAVGYSPERINPGDTINTIQSITKVISASNQNTLSYLQEVYSRALKAKLHPVKSIEVAEAAKIIENIQRDVNIALINELTILFNNLDIDTKSVLEAAGTKWNFLPFKPGLVGGHCIGVDPYYLMYKANEVNFHPEVIGAGRRVNDNMASYCVSKAVNTLIKNENTRPKVLILGITFKANCSDIRNSKVVDLIRGLEKYNIEVYVFDPIADRLEVEQEYKISLLSEFEISNFDMLILAQDHKQIMTHISTVLEMSEGNPLVFDLTGALPDSLVNLRI
jgi:UDP-N-acetyl-D-glucosamine/UDP-N-acetyl-D-galactosamine dehydrogenase